MAMLTFLRAIREALAEELRRDPNVFLLGLEVRVSAFGQTAKLVDEFGPERILDTPIAENSIAGVSIGAAMNGMRPVVEFMYCDFAMLAMDQICTNMGQWRYITGNQYPLPITVRTAVGGGLRHAHGHSQSLECVFAHAPGLILAVPSTPYHAKGLLKSAIRSDDPVLVFEHKKLILGGFESEVPDEDYTLPFGKAEVRRQGTDTTVVATMYMVHEALAAAEELAQEGIEVEVIDPCTIVPLDKETIFASVAKTGRLVVAEEGRIRCGLGAEIAALACGEYFSLLKAPVKRVAAPMVPVPGSPVLEDFYLPNKNSIVRAVREINEDPPFYKNTGQ